MKRWARVLGALVAALTLIGMWPGGAEAAASFRTPGDDWYVGPHGRLASTGRPGKYAVPPATGEPLVDCANSYTPLTPTIDVTVRAPEIRRSLAFVQAHPSAAQPVRWRVKVYQAIDPGGPLLPVLTTADRAGSVPALTGVLPIGWDSVAVPGLPNGPVYLVGFEVEWLGLDGSVLGAVSHISLTSRTVDFGEYGTSHRIGLKACIPHAGGSGAVLALVDHPEPADELYRSSLGFVRRGTVGQEVSYTLRRFPLNATVLALLHPVDPESASMSQDGEVVDTAVTEADGSTVDSFAFPPRPQGYYRLVWRTENSAWRETHPVFLVEPAVKARATASAKGRALTVALTGHCASVPAAISLVGLDGKTLLSGPGQVEPVRLGTVETDESGSARATLELPLDVPAGTATLRSATECGTASTGVTIPKPEEEAQEAAQTEPADGDERAATTGDEDDPAGDPAEEPVTAEATAEATAETTGAAADEPAAADDAAPAPTEAASDEAAPAETVAAEPTPEAAPTEAPAAEAPAEEPAAEAPSAEEAAADAPVEAPPADGAVEAEAEATEAAA